ncbi:unnamed protein product, partial [marine sediment metagenome]
MMFKRKCLWIIPIIVALVAVAGVFAAPSPMPGADQGGVALAQQPDEIPGVVYKTANGGHWHSSPEQIEQINKL